MVCHPCQAAGNLSRAAHGERITGVGHTYMERLKGQVACGECGERRTAGSLSSHLMTQHGRSAEIRQQWITPAAGIVPQTYRMSFLSKGGTRKCPVSVCPARVATRTAMRVHFVQQHVLNTLVILEEGNSPHPRCALCDMLFPRQALNGRHLGTAQCKKGAERKKRRLAEAETRESSERAFEAYGEPIKNVSAFKYMGRVLTAGNDNCLAVVGNLGKAQRTWGQVSRVMGRDGADQKVSRPFYKAVIQAVLLFGAETWVLTTRMEKSLEIFQSRVARRITGRQLQRKKDGIWEYPSLAGALMEAGLVGIRTYITRRQNTVAQYIVTRPIVDLWKRATRRTGARVSRRWWDQAGIDLEGAGKWAAESTTRYETESEE